MSTLMSGVIPRGMFNIVAVAILGIVIQGCGSSSDSMRGGASDSPIVAKVGDYNLTLNEFERQYIRNNGGEEAALKSTPEERKDFLNLLVKYHLKVQEARDLGYHKDPEVQTELNEYRDNLAEPYLMERAIIDPNVEELYERRKEEVRVAHILIRPITDTLGVTDTLAMQKRVDSIFAALQAGEDFAVLAQRYSDDETTKKKGGDLYFFTAGMTVPAFDAAAYSLKPGEVYQEPVETMFGWHIIKMIERQPTRGEIKVSHILARFDPENPEDTTAQWDKIHAIQDSLNAGQTFEAIAMRHSEDPQSAKVGGDLGWGGRRRFVQEFEEVAYSLDVGEVSDIVRTPFGYHLIMLTDERPMKSYEELKPELKDTYRRYGYNEDRAAFIANLKTKFNGKIHRETIDQLVPHLDTTTTTSAAGWYNDIPGNILEKPFVSLTGKTITVDDAVKIIERNRDYQSTSLRHFSVMNMADKMLTTEAIKMETKDLEEQYPEFAELMQDYREGVLLFRAEQEAVWNKVSIDSTNLRAFWETKKDNYTWPDRVAFKELFVTNDSLAKVMKDSLDAGIEFAELAARHTQRTGYKEKGGDWGFVPVDKNELSKKANELTVGAVEGPMKFQYGYSIIRVTGKDPARTKTFDEAYSEVSSKFQEHESKRLENEWIQSLKDKFGVETRESVLEEAFSDLHYSPDGQPEGAKPRTMK